MKSPFPGMDPYLEIHWLWPDVHLELIHEIRAALASQVAPRYFVAVEERTYINVLHSQSLVGKPDVALIGNLPPREGRVLREAAAMYVEPLTIELRREEVVERYLEVRETSTQELVTSIEILSPGNKRAGNGRKAYLEKRELVLDSLTNLVEIDLLRAGEPFDLGEYPETHYRILVSRGWERPRAQLYAFHLDKFIPEIPIPLREQEPEPTVKLNDIVHQVYDTARYDLRINYAQPTEPPLEGEWVEWAKRVVESAQQTT